MLAFKLCVYTLLLLYAYIVIIMKDTNYLIAFMLWYLLGLLFYQLVTHFVW